MRILYDYQAFLMQTHGGISKSFIELITHLPKEIQIKISIIESNNLYLKDSQLIPNIRPCSKTLDNFLCKFNFRGKYHLFNFVNQLFPNYPSSLHINRKESIEVLKEGNFDIFHPTFFEDYYYNFIGKKPLILTIHDMIPELFPDVFSRRDMQIINKRKLVKRANHIIAVSEQTKSDIINLLNVPEEKITVIYHGAPNICLEQKNAIIKEKYILYVGNRSVYKNFIPFIRSFAKVVQYHPNIKLVCTGIPFSKREQSLFNSLKLQDKIISIFASDEQLSNLYQHAVCFIYPSLYEGFGIPILEAYANNCPVLLNNTSCFPEIGKDSALYFQLNSQDDTLTDVLLKFLSDENNFRKYLISKGQERLKDFSWEKSATQLAQLYQSIL